MDLWTFEREIVSKNENAVICGVDEAGRGPLCGPVYAAAVILPYGLEIEGLNDSKKLSEKKRDILYDIIIREAVDFSVAFSTEKEIDEINILNASLLAMRRAVSSLKKKPDAVLVDGNKTTDFGVFARAIVKGDSKSANIAAASILAKVSRDRYMKKLAEEYPEYMLEKHKGYPTKEHYALLQKYGVKDFYRKSFLKNLESHYETR